MEGKNRGHGAHAGRYKDDLSLLLTRRGVAQPCLEIQKDIEKSYELTRRWNLCAVITTTARLVFGSGAAAISAPEAGMPGRSWRANACSSRHSAMSAPGTVTTDGRSAVRQDARCGRIQMLIPFRGAFISGSFGGVNLRISSAPRCFEIERKLKERCDIPIVSTTISTAPPSSLGCCFFWV